MGENICINEPNSARGEQENDNESPQGSKREEHARKVMEAHQRRERARWFSSFTRVPDLQRVWAPKQPKAMKSNSWEMSNRKDHKRGSYDKKYDALLVFKTMSSCGFEPDNYMYPCLLKVCSGLNSLWVEAWRVLDEMPSRDVVSWNSMVAGYAQSGRFDDALEVCREMEPLRLKLDAGTMAS
ncbi:hypothetical protein Q3G72_032187 [Acer saccharum]|nr:hypothetical protein Q3G72_032187 [Acer saccharum]